MGRPPRLMPHQQREAIRRRNAGKESLTETGRSYNVSAATISRFSPWSQHQWTILPAHRP
jgi:DNA invertase Pin-like site-specific DNA recombinase